jgi:protein-disulfide isomerase
MWTKVERYLAILTNGVVIAAALVVLVTQVNSRWIEPARRLQPQDVQGLTIPQSAIRHTKGEAPIAIVEFTDYECPFCGQHARTNAPLIDRGYVDRGALRHIVFNFPLKSHSQAQKASEAAECAGRQGRYWEMHRQLFGPQADLDERGLETSAEALGIDRETFSICLRGRATEHVAADIALGRRLGVNSTPTFFIGAVERDGSVRLLKRINGALPMETFRNAIESISRRHRGAV